MYLLQQNTYINTPHTIYDISEALSFLLPLFFVWGGGGSEDT